MNQPRPLQHVVIGVGAGVFGMHRPALELNTVALVSVSDTNAELGQQRAKDLNCAFYADHHKMLAETQPDVAVILTPHSSHAALAVDCLQAGCHVLVEKPMAVQVAEADAMIEAATRAGRLLAVNFQQRYRPEVQAARRLIQNGQLGLIQRVTVSATWPRTAAYYGLADWRATWAGEGGGVLMNQAPHDLDLLCYLLGLPNRVVAWTRTLLHEIETEDTVHAMLEWSGGALGFVHISTAEAGPPQRLDVVGTAGFLHLGWGELVFHRLEADLREFIAHSPDPYRAPQQQQAKVELEHRAGDHVAIYRDLHEAILHGAQPIADGVQGRLSLELANAMVFSNFTRGEVDLPLDRQAYAALLEDLKVSAR